MAAGPPKKDDDPAAAGNCTARGDAARGIQSLNMRQPDTIVEIRL